MESSMSKPTLDAVRRQNLVYQIGVAAMVIDCFWSGFFLVGIPEIENRI